MVWQRVSHAVSGEGELEHILIDSTIVRAHKLARRALLQIQHAHGLAEVVAQHLLQAFGEAILAEGGHRDAQVEGLADRLRHASSIFPVSPLGMTSESTAIVFASLACAFGPLVQL